MSDEIIELLKNKKLRAEVVKTIKEVYSYAGTLNDNPTEDMEEAVEKLGTSLWEEAWWRGETFGNCERIGQAFHKYVIDKMSRPPRITLDDIANGFVLLAKTTEYTLPEPDFENVYTVFLNFVENCLLSQKRSSIFEICRSPTLHRRLEWFFAGEKLGKSHTEVERAEARAALERILKERLLWSSGNGIIVRCVGDREVDNWYHVFAEFNGNMSRVAFERLQSEVPCLLISIIQSVSLLEPCEKAIPRILPSHLPTLNERTLSDQKLLIHSCLGAFYSEPKTKDSIDKRVRNAVYLLMESDAHSNDAIGVALSVTAIEALLGRGGNGIAEKLSMDVAVLLEPDLSKRNKATEFVKQMYTLRSNTLHGKSIESKERVRDKARLLAAGVLRALVTRRDFMVRAGYTPEAPQDLLKELREVRFQPGQPMGVDEPKVRKLWDCA